MGREKNTLISLPGTLRKPSQILDKYFHLIATTDISRHLTKEIDDRFERLPEIVV